MRHLLDVNVLLALALADHEYHVRVVTWMKPAQSQPPFPVATCAVVELGFVRILSQPVHGYTIEEAKLLLKKVKGIRDLDFEFLEDDQSVAGLPAWVSKSGQVTDGHLVQLAARHVAKLATLDEKIPGAFLAPR